MKKLVPLDEFLASMPEGLPVMPIIIEVNGVRHVQVEQESPSAYRARMEGKSDG